MSSAIFGLRLLTELLGLLLLIVIQWQGEPLRVVADRSSENHSGVLRENKRGWEREKQGKQRHASHEGNRIRLGTIIIETALFIVQGDVMNKGLVRVVAIAAMSAGAMFAQDVTGTWQGTLTVPGAKQELRLMFKITKNGDKLAGNMYSIDQTPQAIPMTSIAVQGGMLKFQIPGGAAAFEGKLDSDGVNAIGNFTQGQAVPLNLKHVKDAEAWEIPKPAAPAKQLKGDDPSFEVATIKPSRPDSQGFGITLRGRDVITINTSLAQVIAFVYELHPRQLTGGPAWVEGDRFDIEGKPEGEGMPNVVQMRVMLKKLLADRFQLKFHTEQKELSVFVLGPGKNGPKLTPSGASDNLPGLGFRGLGDMFVRNATLKDFTGTMQMLVVDRPVVDQTGLKGRFDFTLKWTPDETQFGGRGGRGAQPENVEAPPDLFSAIQEQLGLKLTAMKTAVDVMVIDKATKPSDN
jgi:uncharacterized protein (TIGR03435 family)